MPRINLRVKHPPRIKTTSKGQALKIYNTKRWQKLRLAKIHQNPLCELCEKKNPPAVVVAREVDHITPFSEGSNFDDVLFLAYDWENLQSLCIPCHKDKHNNKLRRY